MNAEDIKTIMSFSLFKGYTEHGVEHVLERSTIQSLAEGELLFKEGEAPSAVFLVLAGSLEVFVERQGRLIPINKMLPGTIVGEMGALCGHPRSASARSMEPTRIVRWENSMFRWLLVGDFSLFERIFGRAIQVLIERERQLIEQVTQAHQ
jgi:CRP-like cAMP-binding protein